MSLPGSDRTGSGQTATHAVLALVGVALLAGRASAHSGSLSGSIATATVPTWLVIMTGGVVVGASFLFTTLLTDHDAMRRVNWWGIVVPAPATVRLAVARILRVVGIGALGLIVVTGLTGPTTPTRNFAVLFVWVGWWSGYTMTTYLVGNTWPSVNPWRTMAAVGRRFSDALAGRLPDRYHRLPETLVGRLSGTAIDRLPEPVARQLPAAAGTWPAVVGLLALVWLEVVSPIGSNARLLALVVLAYSVVTVAGAIAFESWFERVDPISRVFGVYGRVAPIQRTDDGLSVRLPGMALTDEPLADRPGEVAFVVALLWVTTYDGLVATPAWASAIEFVVGVGVPALLVYLVVLLCGFALFLGVYRLASMRVRETADTYVTRRAIERWFAPALLPIAAGYHVAHFLGYFVGLVPALGAVAASPLAPPVNTVVFVLPEWFGNVKLICVLAGHVLAVWVAHSLAFELFPGVLAAIRSQYPSVVVMIFYTMSSLWVITQPYVPPPFV